MALVEAVLEVVRQMDESLPLMSGEREEIEVSIKVWSAQLRIAIKAAEGQQPSQAALPFNPAQLFLGSPEAQHSNFIEQERERIRREKRLAEGEEQFEPRLVQAVGGESDGDFVATEHGTPAGAKTFLGGQVYVYDGKQWCFSEEETGKAAKPAVGPKIELG